MEKSVLKLILYRECKEVKSITEPNSDESLTYILEIAEKWKKEDAKRNTIKFSIEK